MRFFWLLLLHEDTVHVGALPSRKYARQCNGISVESALNEVHGVRYDFR
jgi:hypothetical protein